MKSFVLAATLALAGAALAQNASDMTDGEVRKVDKGAAKVTIKHGEIKNLEMPPMTMVFQVKDAALLDKVKAGDKVKFRAEKAGSGYVVTAIEASP
jgi:Cu(I)/Ag(I) efflux system periplasmic protein CusF